MAADDLLPSYQFAAVKQRTSPELRRQIQYELILRQQPKQSRMCGVGEKADRRPIDPPPIVQLIVRAPGPKGEYTPYLQNPYYFMHASLVEKDTKEEVHLIKDNKTKATTGSSVSSLYPLKDTDGSSTDSGFFVFPDLSVRMEGTYRLKFCLYEMVGREVYFCSSVISAPLTVYSAKKFPGMEESTALSQSFAEQGLKIRIRKEIRPKKKRRGIHPSIPPSIAIKEEGLTDFQQESDDNDLEKSSSPLTVDGQRTKRRHKSVERTGKNDMSKRSVQATKRVTYPSTPSQSSTMEVDSSASSVASLPDSSTHATEITRRSSGSSVGHPFPEIRHMDSDADMHRTSPDISRRVSADSHGPANYSMPPPGSSNYHYVDYQSHRSPQSHTPTPTPRHPATESRVPTAPTHALSYSYYGASRANTAEPTQQTPHEPRRRSESSHVAPPSFDPCGESYPVEYSSSYPSVPRDPSQSRRSSADQRYHLATAQQMGRPEPGSSHDGAPPTTYARPYTAAHPTGNQPSARSPRNHSETTSSVEGRPLHYPSSQHAGQPSRHYGYPPSDASVQDPSSYGQGPVHHHHHHHHYHVVSPYDAPRISGTYTEVIVSGPPRSSYGPGFAAEAPPPSRTSSFRSQDALPSGPTPTSNSPTGRGAGHEAPMPLISPGHAKSGALLPSADERPPPPSDYFGHRPVNGHDGTHRHAGYYYPYGFEGGEGAAGGAVPPPHDPSVPPHHRRTLSASAASVPADPLISLPRDIAATPSGSDRSNRSNPLPHRHSSQGIPGGGTGLQHYPTSTVTSPPIHPLSMPKSGIEYGHPPPAATGPPHGRSSGNTTGMPLPHRGEAGYPVQPWTHTAPTYKSSNGEPHYAVRPPSLGQSPSTSLLPSVTSTAHTGPIVPLEHHTSYAYPSSEQRRSGGGGGHHGAYRSVHSSGSSSSRPGSHSSAAQSPNTTLSSVSSRQQPHQPPSRGCDAIYASASPRYPPPMSDVAGHPGGHPPTSSTWYESSPSLSSHEHHAGVGPMPTVVNGGGGVGVTSVSNGGHPSVLEMRDARSSGAHGPHVLAQPPSTAVRPVEPCADMLRGYPSRRNS